jgi:hypothetical protein
VRCGELNGCDQAVEVVAFGFCDDLETGFTRLGRCHGADADAPEVTAQHAERARSGGRRDYHEVCVGKRIGLELDGAIERDLLGSELPDNDVAGIFGGRVQHAAVRRRKLLCEPFLGRALGDEVRVEAVGLELLGRPRADRRDPGRAPCQPPHERFDRVSARDEDPVIALAVDRRALDLLDSDERRLDDVEPARAQALAQAPVRSRDGDSHGTAARSSSARATGSSPRLRSIHAPSSAAISAVSASPS